MGPEISRSSTLMRGPFALITAGWGSAGLGSCTGTSATAFSDDSVWARVCTQHVQYILNHIAQEANDDVICRVLHVAIPCQSCFRTVRLDV
eukprot:6959001-Pyramimonas_sp.AAC.1